MADLLVLLRPERACKMALGSAKKLKETGPVEKERMASLPQSEQLARMSGLPLLKGKGIKIISTYHQTRS